MGFLTSLFSQKTKTFFKKFRKFNALSNIDRQMLEYLNYSNGYFIECGANDGVDQSNTWYYEKHLNWSGILVEPLKNQYIELVKNRSDKNNFYNFALIENDKIDKVSFKNTNLTSRVILVKEDTELNVSSTTLKNILVKSKAPNLIDFFSLDVEGYEEQVIKGNDFNIYNFKYFLVETKNDHVIKMIKDKNYILIKKLSHHDYLFKFNH